MAIDATAPIGDRASFAPPRILGLEGFELEPLLQGWVRPAGDPLTSAVDPGSSRVSSPPGPARSSGGGA